MTEINHSGLQVNGLLWLKIKSKSKIINQICVLKIKSLSYWKSRAKSTTSHPKVLGQIWTHPHSRFKTSRASKTDTKEQERAPTVAGISKSRQLIPANLMFTMETNYCLKTWSLATPNQSLWRIAYSRGPSTRIEMFVSQPRNWSTGTTLKIFLSLRKTI